VEYAASVFRVQVSHEDNCNRFLWTSTVLDDLRFWPRRHVMCKHVITTFRKSIASIIWKKAAVHTETSNLKHKATQCHMLAELQNILYVLVWKFTGWSSSHSYLRVSLHLKCITRENFEFFPVGIWGTVIYIWETKEYCNLFRSCEGTRTWYLSEWRVRIGLISQICIVITFQTRGKVLGEVG
jgi:hypothetical protein